MVDEGLYSQKDKEQLAEELRDAEKKLTRISQRSPQLTEEKRAAQPDWLLFRKKLTQQQITKSTAKSHLR